jgi:hypothetical protein
MLRGPGLRNVDISINKDTKVRWLGEAGLVEFRAELFNVLNHPNWLAPGGTMWAGAPSGTTTGTAASGQFCGSTQPTSTNGVFDPYFVSGCAVPIVNSGGSITAGQITSTSTKSRQIQLALKIVF